MTERHEMEQAIARDLELCDIGLAMTKGKTRRKYAEHRKACMAQIAAWNRADGLDATRVDDIFSELTN